MKHLIRRPLTLEERNLIGGTSDIVAHLLFHRGITSAESGERFLSPDYDRDTHDPFLLKDAEKAALRIIEAMKREDLIAVYSDYDADGIPGAALFADFFRRAGYERVMTYIPHRHDEGFGVNVAAVEEIVGAGAKLMITIDCGVTDVAAIARAVELGMDVIVTDHHEPPAILPPAYAIVNHRQADCAYPDKGLCGSGVAYKLIQAILKSAKMVPGAPAGLTSFKAGHEKWLLDLVGIATLSDMVPLVGENRAFARYGLQVLQKSPRKGLVRLLQKLKIAQRHLTEDDVAFMVTPRINAASRMGAPMDAFRLLSAETDDDAEEWVAKLEAVNTERKGVVALLVKEVKKILADRYGGGDVPPAIVLGNPEWRPSLLGLVANTCASEFRRPVFLWGRDGEGLIKGSCRSEGDSSVVDIMRAAVPGTFAQYGGHHHSGGFGVDHDQIHFLEMRLHEAAAKSSSKHEDSVSPNDNRDYIDMELRLDDVDWRLSDDLAKLAPFGTGNPKPTFLFREVTPISIRRFGKTGGDHIEMTFAKRSGAKVSAIAFFGAAEPWADKVKDGHTCDLVASVEKSMFRGRPELRLRVVDVVL